MLSIGKLTAGREAYYLDLLEHDDYYLTPTEEPGRWVGALAGRLGLGGRVDPDQYRAVLDGRHPATGLPLVANSGQPERVTGFDLTFSAPKSVSVLWALGDPTIAAAVLDAHDRAVADALGLLEAEAVVARRGHGGAVELPGQGLVAAAFGHRTSRSGDPQLHTHVVTANLTAAVDGRWSALYGRKVYAWAKTTGYAYQAALRHHLTTSLGVSWTPVQKGTAEIAGIPAGARDRFSTRRAEITAHLDALGLSSPKAAGTATLATRAAKQPVGDLDALRSTWRDAAADLHLEPAAVTGPPRQPVVPEVTSRLLGADGLTAHATHFDRRAVVQALATAAADGALPHELRQRADRLLDRPGVIALGGEPPVTGRRYSTLELLAVETRLVERANARISDRVGTAPADVLAAVLADRPSLGDDQAAVVGSLVTSGAGVEVVVGKAGTGKTYTLDAARAAWQASGHTVIGAALAARAAAQMQAGAGIPSSTVARLLGDLDRSGPLSGLPPRTVLVIDEAGMVGTRSLDRLLAHAERARAKVVLVGDPRQLPEIEAGGALAALARRVPTTTLDANRRQRDDWERTALDQLRSGSVTEAVAAYRTHGRVRLAPTADATRQALVDEWWTTRRDHPGEAVAMYAATRADVADLNARARARMRADGSLTGSDVTVAGRPFAPGDEVVCLRNDRRLGIHNGTAGTLTGIAADGATIATAGGPVELPGWYLEEGRLTHAYATTVHKAQGATVDRAFVLGSDQLYREAGYVGMSRARTETRLYVVDPGQSPDRRQLDPLREVTLALAASRAQTLAVDQQPQLDPIALLADPPEWALRHLGEPPLWGPDRQRWVEHVGRVAAYATNPADAFGPEPTDPSDRLGWLAARLAGRTHDRDLGRDR